MINLHRIKNLLKSSPFKKFKSPKILLKLSNPLSLNLQ